MFQTHSGNRPHVCAVCRKRFYQSSDLKRHMQSHLKQVANNNSKFINLGSQPCLNVSIDLENHHNIE